MKTSESSTAGKLTKIRRGSLGKLKLISKQSPSASQQPGTLPRPALPRAPKGKAIKGASKPSSGITPLMFQGN